MKHNPTLVKLRDQFCVIKNNQEFSPILHKPLEKRAENCCEGGLSTVNCPHQMKEEYY